VRAFLADVIQTPGEKSMSNQGSVNPAKGAGGSRCGVLLEEEHPASDTTLLFVCLRLVTAGKGFNNGFFGRPTFGYFQQDSIDSNPGDGTPLGASQASQPIHKGFRSLSSIAVAECPYQARSHSEGAPWRPPCDR
jgi:hypothetical protein